LASKRTSRGAGPISGGPGGGCELILTALAGSPYFVRRDLGSFGNLFESWAEVDAGHSELPHRIPVTKAS
jgi:hypothetical protein